MCLRMDGGIAFPEGLVFQPCHAACCCCLEGGGGGGASLTSAHACLCVFPEIHSTVLSCPKKRQRDRRRIYREFIYIETEKTEDER